MKNKDLKHDIEPNNLINNLKHDADTNDLVEVKKIKRNAFVKRTIALTAAIAILLGLHSCPRTGDNDKKVDHIKNHNYGDWHYFDNNFEQRECECGETETRRHEPSGEDNICINCGHVIRPDVTPGPVEPSMEPEPSATPSATPDASPTPGASSTPAATQTPSPSEGPNPTPTGGPNPSNPPRPPRPPQTPTPVPTATPTPTPAPKPTVTPTPAPSVTPAPTPAPCKHDYETEVTVEDRNGTHVITTTIKCKKCGKIDISVTTHKKDMAMVSQDDDGTDYACQKCSITEHERHSLSEFEHENGDRTFTCKNGCGYSKTVVHTPNYTSTIKNNGNGTHTIITTCTNCGHDGHTHPETRTVEDCVFTGDGMYQTCKCGAVKIADLDDLSLDDSLDKDRPKTLRFTPIKK